jgi:hypothetical protein
MSSSSLIGVDFDPSPMTNGTFVSVLTESSEGR